MKKILLILATIVALTMVACSEDPFVEVSFDTDGGSAIASQRVYVDSKLKALGKNPTKDGYAFVAWYTDKEHTELFDFDTPITENMVLYADYDQAFVTFSSSSKFTLTVKRSDSLAETEGKIYYSFDGAEWFECTSDEINADAVFADDDYRILVRGVGNTVVTGADTPWVIGDSASEVSCSGNILTILDYKKTKKEGETITVGASAFASMFKGCTKLISIPTIPSIPFYGANTFKSMFESCSNLHVSTVAPTEGAYQTFISENGDPDDFCLNMFNGCCSNGSKHTPFGASLTTRVTYYISKAPAEQPC